MTRQIAASKDLMIDQRLFVDALGIDTATVIAPACRLGERSYILKTDSDAYYLLKAVSALGDMDFAPYWALYDDDGEFVADDVTIAAVRKLC